MNNRFLIHPGIPVKVTTRLNLRKLYSIYLGLLPLLMFVRFPFTDYGFGTILSLLFLPYVIGMSVNSGRTVNRDDSGLAIFFLYIMARSIGNFSSFMLYGIAFVHILCVHVSADWNSLKKTIIAVSAVSSVVIAIQRFLLFFGVHASFLINDLLLEEFRETSSVYSGDMMNRVSGLFIEPSHFSEYALVGLILLLANMRKNETKKRDYVIVAVICLGILGSTSGIGLIGMIAIVVYHILFIRYKGIYPFVVRLLILVILVAAGGALLYAIPLTRLSFLRIIGKVDDYNAVWGRTVHLSYYLNQLSGKTEWIFGKGVYEFEYYLLGFAGIIYQYGYCGLALFFFSLFTYILKKNRVVIMLCLLYGGFLFVTNTTGFLNMIFYFCVICSAQAYYRNHKTDDGGKIK